MWEVIEREGPGEEEVWVKRWERSGDSQSLGSRDWGGLGECHQCEGKELVGEVNRQADGGGGNQGMGWVKKQTKT